MSHVPNSELLFGPFDVFCAEMAPMTPRQAARHRIELVWAGYVDINRKSSLSESLHDVGQLVGYFCDLHVPLLIAPDPPDELHLVYRFNLAPEQNAEFPVIIGGPIETSGANERQLYQLIEELTAVNTVDSQPLTAAGKLLAKGKPRPRSVRYIRPQLIRCCTEPSCSKLAEFILRAHFLETYRHNQTTVEPAKRVEIYRTPLIELATTVTNSPSKVLYGIISEAIAAMLISSIKLLMAAERSWGTLTQYIEHALTKNISVVPAASSALPAEPVVPSVDRPARFRSIPSTEAEQLRFVRAITSELNANRVAVLPLHPSAAVMQQKALAKNVGIDEMSAVCCDLCGILHIKSNKMARKGSKDRVGVTYCMDTGQTTCNACRTHMFCRKIPMIGVIVLTKPTTSTVWASVGICSMCGLISSPMYTRAVQPYCRECYSATGESIMGSIRCACGNHWNRRSTPLLCKRNGRIVFMGPCRDHSDVFPHTYGDNSIQPLEQYKAVIDRL